MKLLWHANFSGRGSGYFTQSETVVPRIRDLGHELTISSYPTGRHEWWKGIEVLPPYADVSGNDMLYQHAAHAFGAAEDGVVIALCDAWILQPQVLEKLKAAIWAPIDHEPPPPAVLQTFLSAPATVPIAMSKHGEEQMRRAGLDPLYVPHMIDTEVFKPQDRREAREALGLPEDAFVIGVVAVNQQYGQHSRKAYPQIMEAFARFSRLHDDALLYLHTDVLGVRDGVDLLAMAHQLRISHERLRIVDQYAYRVGIPVEHMVTTYNAFDVLLNPSFGEGFGLPIVEAQACGVPAIVTDFGAMRETCGVGWKVDCDPFYTGFQSWQRVPRVDSIVDALNAAKGTAHGRSKEARKFVERTYSPEVVMPVWEKALATLGERLELGAERKLAAVK
jgi:glycosyltransferase involved in cell wall biosynthesis